MTQFARFQRTIADEAGNIQAGAKVEVRSEATGALATLYSDRLGASGLSNPVTADADGFAAFHVAGGAYKVRAYLGSSASPTFERIWRYVGIGRGAEVDNLDGVSAGTTRTLSLGGSPLDTTLDPGAGALTFNNAVMASVTEIAIDVLNLGGGNEADWIAALGVGLSATKSRVEIRNAADPLVDFAIFDVTAAAVQGSPATFYRLTVSHVASGGSLADDQTVNITSTVTGAKGDLGSDGSDPGVLLTWDEDNTDSAPAGGGIKADDDALGSATTLYVALTNRAGNSIATFLANLDRSTNTVRKGGIVLTRPSDGAQALFDLDSVTTDGSPATYYKLGVSGHSGATGFTATDALSFQFSADGDKGADGGSLVTSVQGNTGDIDLKGSDVGALRGITVRLATTAAINIATDLNTAQSPLPTIDGVTIAEGDFVLVKDQSGGSPDTAPENGVYEAGASPARVASFDAYDDHPGALVTVQEGSTNADTQWLCTSNRGGTIDSTAIAFAPATPQGVALVGESNTFTVAQTVAVTSAGTALSLSSSDAGASSGPNLQFDRNSASPAIADSLAAFNWTGRDDAASTISYGIIGARITTPAAASAAGYLYIQTLQTAAVGDRMRIGGGIFHPSATGTDKGNNTINYGAVYDDNSLLTCMALSKEFLADGKIDLKKWDALVPDQEVPEVIEERPVTRKVRKRVERAISEQTNIRLKSTVETVEEPVMEKVPVLDDAGRQIAVAERQVTERIVHAASKIKRIHGTARLFKAMTEDGFDPRDPEQYFAKLKSDEALPGMPTKANWKHNDLSIGEQFSRKWLAVEMLAIVCNAMWIKLKEHETRLDRIEARR